MLLSVRLLSTVLLNVSENGGHAEYFPVNVGGLSFGSFNPEVDARLLSSVTVCDCLGRGQKPLQYVLRPFQPFDRCFDLKIGIINSSSLSFEFFRNCVTFSQFVDDTFV